VKSIVAHVLYVVLRAVTACCPAILCAETGPKPTGGSEVESGEVTILPAADLIGRGFRLTGSYVIDGKEVHLQLERPAAHPTVTDVAGCLKKLKGVATASGTGSDPSGQAGIAALVVLRPIHDSTKQAIVFINNDTLIAKQEENWTLYRLQVPQGLPVFFQILQLCRVSEGESKEVVRDNRGDPFVPGS
jgi:hypothetical protein